MRSRLTLINYGNYKLRCKDCVMTQGKEKGLFVTVCLEQI